VGIIFVISALTKFLNLESFTESLNAYKLFSQYQIILITYLLPPIEFFLACLLLLNIKIKFVSTVTLFLLIIFTAILSVKYFEGEQISCGCFGELTIGKVTFITIFRNIALILICIYLYFYSTNERNMLQLNSSLKKIFFNQTKSVFVISIIVFLSIQNLFFVLQNRGLKNSLSLLTYEKSIIGEGQLVSSFHSRLLSGTEEFINLENMKSLTLLLIFSKECKPCLLNVASWNLIYRNFKNSNVNFLGITYDSNLELLKTFVNKNNIEFRVNAIENLNELNFNIMVTPQTLIIDKYGKVLKSYRGILKEDEIKDISLIIESYKI
jgi:peroxiredoxin